MSALFVYITTPDETSALRIVEALLEERLCAGANILGGIRSLYRWQGEISRRSECVCILKTMRKHYPALEKCVRALHPYEVPCIVALPVECAFAPFLQWIEDQTRS
ncbi:MAG: divalent-cation tolerance protein CutA [Desulfovibrio sp.]|jgi:periplasmic divalent cation tolerance protein|nr:divalent-cation tolerance protein CutA [Desulfovibrio sp.]